MKIDRERPVWNVEVDVLWSLVKEISTYSVKSPIIKKHSAAEIDAAIPEISPHGATVESLAKDLQSLFLNYSRRNAHAGLLSHILAPGLPIDPVSHAIVAALNQNPLGFFASPLATQIERYLVKFFADLAGFPSDSGGLVLSGGSGANFSALATALYKGIGKEALDNGLSECQRPLVIAAQSAHFSVPRAVRLLGLGNRGVEWIPLDAIQRMRVDLLEKRLQQLHSTTGTKVVCVVATAGTTAAGAIDSLPEIGQLCKAYGVWFHVDAAYGGSTLLSPILKGRLNGIESADSIVIDFHKWCYLALEGSLLLYRNPRIARNIFQISADYLLQESGDSPEDYTNFDLSIELSRRFRALPAYIALTLYGTEMFSMQLEENVRCAIYLANAIQESEDFELVVAPQLSTCCFRYAPHALLAQPTYLDALNKKLLKCVNSSGEFMLSMAEFQGRPALRACIRNYATSQKDMDSLLKHIRRSARSIES